MERVLTEEHEELTGVVSCDCNRFPVLEGILRLVNDELSEPILEYLGRGEAKDALLIALRNPYSQVKNTLVKLALEVAGRLKSRAVEKSVIALKKPFYVRITRADTRFCDLTQGMKKVWGEWCRYRFSMETFLSSFPLSSLTGLETGYVLDFGSNVGHNAFLISRFCDEERIVCADLEFTSLYLGKRYFTPKANFICLDGNFLLPFEDNFFVAFYSCDAFQYVHSKLLLSREVMRTVSPRGVIIFSHLTSSAGPHARYGGTLLSPRGYAELFDGRKQRMIPEEKIIEDFLSTGVLDLTSGWDAEQMNDVQGFSLVASGDDSYFIRHENLWRKLLDRAENLIVNPLYNVKLDGDKCRLSRKSYSKRYEQLVGTLRSYIPESFEIEAEKLAKITRRSADGTGARDAQEILPLLKQFILLEVPRGFSR